MKSTVEQLTPTRVKLNVEVPFEELSADFDRTYRSLAQQIRIPGFRPGKAPAKLIEARVGRDSILAQVVNEAIPGKYSEAVAETETKAIGQPEIDLSELKYGESVTFTAEVDVRPEITLPDYSTLSVEVDPVEIDDAAVDEQLEGLRARFGTLQGVERGAADGDFVSIDLAAEVDGEPVDEASTEGLSHEVGSGQLIDGLDEALVGLAAGETKVFTTKLVAGDHAGEEAAVTVTVNSVKERELPEVDDEFAQMASEFDTVDELKESLRERVATSKKLEQANAIRDKVLEQLLETVEVPLPEKVVESQIEGQQHQIIHALGHDDEQLAKFLEAQGTTREKWDAEARDEAEKSVRTELLLDAIAEQQDTQVSQDELTQQIIFQAQRYGMQPQEFIQQLSQANQVGAVFAEVRRGKALAGIVKDITVTDTTGAAVDTSEFFGDDSDSADDETSADNETAADTDN
ncbi:MULTISPECIES: trigger factor [unclassified Gordonia (in: high G+C Gram-positive bacteria)]|uniref:trigger factor n=1 Tax=unclassified Gordonia (in: high G+C Gram-positive bacteria) TaxID=2657482 RepID=UPI001F10293A|nr:trigger factor [Gordonia sp. ABSL49_1]MCH5644118.1 trigger factor [Gordonia sp. ABSL49_1]